MVNITQQSGSRGAFPGPHQLMSLTTLQRGLTEEKVARLGGVAEAALSGALGRAHLRAMGAEEALESLQRHESRLIRTIQAAYQLSTDTDIEAVTDAWRPYRAWVTLLLRTWLDDENASGHRPDDHPILKPPADR